MKVIFSAHIVHSFRSRDKLPAKKLIILMMLTTQSVREGGKREDLQKIDGIVYFADIIEIHVERWKS